jgi:tyrosyl-tRNA synthetase
MNWKVPVAVHHKLLPGLTQPTGTSTEAKMLGKMSKTNPNSTIFIHDSDEEIKSKINKAWCEEKNIENNPLLEISKQIIFNEYDEMQVERPEKFGGNVSYSDYSQLESAFAKKELHPTDLKQTVAKLLIPIVSKIRDKLALDPEISEIIKNCV